MLDPTHFRRHVVRPALALLDLWSESAEALLVGTALAESGLTWLAQRGGGPALGVFQIEPATHDDIWTNFLAYRRALRQRAEALIAPEPPRTRQLVTNLAYAAAMARIHYLRVPEPLPPAGDVDALGAYWKRHYNTRRGRGTVEGFVEDFRRFA